MQFTIGAIITGAPFTIDAILDDVTGTDRTHFFLINALLKAQGANGNCSEPATDLILSQTNVKNIFNRIGGPLNPPVHLNPVIRWGYRVDGSTFVGKSIGGVQVRRIRNNEPTFQIRAQGDMFCTIRDENDVILTMSQSINANTLSTSTTTTLQFNFEKIITLKEGDIINFEFPDCSNCNGIGGQDGPYIVIGVDTAVEPPTGLLRFFYKRGRIVNGEGLIDEGYTASAGSTNFWQFSFSPASAVTASQNKCFEIDALLRATQNPTTSACSVIYTDDMTTPGNWASTDVTPPGFIDVTGGVLDWEAISDGSSDVSAQNFFSNLGFALLNEGGWRVRFKADFTSVGLGTDRNDFFFYVSDRDNTENARAAVQNLGFEDALGFHFKIGSQGQQVLGFYKDFGLGGDFGVFDVATLNTPLSTGVKHYEFVRNSRTSMTWNFYSDSSYSPSALVDSVTAGIPASVAGNTGSSIIPTGFRYMKASNTSVASSTNALVGSFDDLFIEQDIEGGCFYVDSILQQTQTEGFTIDANILFARAADVDARLAVPVDVTALSFSTPEPVVPLETFIVDAIIVGTKKPFTVDGLLIIVPSRLTLVDAFLQKDLTKQFTVDAVLKALGDNAFCQNLQTDFSEDFSSYANPTAANAVWVPNNLVGFINVDTDENFAEWQNRNVGTNNSMAYDLFTNNGITVSDTAWILRFKHRANVLDLGSSTGKYLWIGLFDSDHTVDSETTQDAISFYINISSGGNGINLAERDGVILSNAGTNSILTKTNTANETFWVELKRESSTSARLSLYSDHLFTQLIESTTLTIPASLTGLRYIAIKNRNLATTTGLMTGTTDDINFWNGVTTIPAVIETGISIKCPTVDAVIKCLGDTGSCSATYSNAVNLSSEWNFDAGGTGFFRLQGAGPIDFNIVRNFGHDFASLDLDPPGAEVRLGQKLNDESFTARWLLEWTTLTVGNGNTLFMGLSDLQTENWVDGQTATPQKGLVIQLTGTTEGTPTSPRWAPGYKDGTVGVTSLGLSVTNLFTTGVTYGIEIRRNSATSATYTLYDSTFTTILQQSTHTIPATVVGLRYFKSTNIDSSSGGFFIMSGEIDDFSVETPREAGTVGSGSVACALVDACIQLETVMETFTIDAILIVSPSDLSLVDALLFNMPVALTCVDALLSSSGEDGSCPAGGETVSSVLDNIDLFDTQVNTNATNFKIGQRWTPTTNEVALLEKGITKVTLWHGHTGGSGAFDTFVWDTASAGTSSENVIRDGGTFFFFGVSSGIAKRTRILFDAGAVAPQNWIPTAGVEYVIGITENFPGTAQTRKTASDTINGVFTTRSSAGVWTNTVGQDWTLQFTIEQSGLGQGAGNFCLGVDGRLQLQPFQQFTVDAILAAPAVVNTKAFLVDGLLAIMPSKLTCVDAILTTITETKVFTVDSLLDDVSATWSYREHELNLAVPPASSFGVEGASPNRYETTTGPPGIANNYLFKSFRKSEITGSNIDITWEKTDTCTSCTSNTFRVIDGAYDKDSLTDFVPGAGGPTSKGAGVLDSFSAFTNHGEQTETLSSINWGGSTEEFVTVIAFITDTNTSPFGTLQIKEFNIKGIPSGGNLKWQFLSPVVTNETTGTDQDAGYVNASLASSSIDKTFTVDALLKVLGENGTCGVNSFTGLKAYYSFDVITAPTHVNQTSILNGATPDTLGTAGDITAGNAFWLDNQLGKVGTSWDFTNQGLGSYGNADTNTFSFMSRPAGHTWTWNTWIKPDATVGSDALAGDRNAGGVNNGFSLVGNNDATEYRIQYTSRASTTDVFSDIVPVGKGIPIDGSFHMLTMTYDQSLTSNNWKVYNDGVLVHQGTRLQTFTNGSSNVSMKFARSAQTNNPFNGFMDETSIWDRVWTPQEIQNVFFQNSNGQELSIQSAGISCFNIDAVLKLLGEDLCAGAGPLTASFTEDFSTNTGWTYTGAHPTKLTVNSGTDPGVLRMQCFRSTAVDGSQQQVKDMNTTINPNNVQTGDIVFEVDYNHITPCGGFAASGSHFSLTENSLNIGDNRTTEPHLTLLTQAVTIGSPGITGLAANYADGTGTIITTSPSISLVNNTQYFPRITKFKTGNLQLEVFTDSARTVHTAGSPTIIDASTVATKELKFIQAASFGGGGNGRQQRTDFDNVVVSQTQGCPSPQVDSLLQQVAQTAGFTVDAQLLQLLTVQTVDFTVDARLVNRNAETFTVDAVLVFRIAKDFTVNAIVVFRIDKDFAVDAFFNRQTQFIVDVSITPDTGAVRDIGDLIVRVLFEDDDLGGSGLTGRQVVDEIRAITEIELQWGFFGKTSRIRSWLNTLKFRGVVQEDGSDPDWYETIWTLV